MIAAIALLAVLAFPWPDAPPAPALDEHSADRAARLAAAEQLARLPTAVAEERLRALLDDLDPTVRLTAARALVRRPDPVALAAATRWLLSGNSADRSAGFEALRGARVLTPEARAALERAVADGDPAVRLAALEVLADRDVRPSLAAVAGALEDSSATVRLTALRLLGDSRDPRAALAVLSRIGDADRGVRREAIAALGALGDLKVVPALLRVLDGPTDELRRAAMEALAGLHAGAAVPALAALARRRPADLVARQAQWALGEVATPEAVAALVTLVRDAPVSDEVRAGLVRAGPIAVLPLVRELESDGGAVAEAAGLLGQLGDRRAVPALVEALRRHDLNLPALLRALAALASPEAVAAVVPLVSDADREVRRLALDALQAIGDDRAVVVLDGALADGDAQVRRHAAVLAGRLRAHAQEHAVAGHLVDADEAVREAATWALGRLGGTAACQALVRAAVARSAPPALLAEALSSSATRDCLPAALAALPGAPAAAHWPLVEAVAAAVRQGDRRGPPAAAVELLIGELGRDERSASAAARAVASARAGDLLAAFSSAVPAVRARLASALATFAAGRAVLAGVLDDRHEDDEVRAAAAWSLAGASEGRAALERARTDLHPAVAANAAAALRAHPPPGSLTVRLGGGPGLPGRVWLRVAVPEVGPVWTRTDILGRATLSGVREDGPAAVTCADPALVVVERSAAR